MRSSTGTDLHPTRHNTVTEHSRKEAAGIGGLRRSQTAGGKARSGSLFASGRDKDRNVSGGSGSGGNARRPASSAGVRSTLPTINGLGNNGAGTSANGTQTNGNGTSPPSTNPSFLSTTPNGTNTHTPIPSRAPSPSPAATPRTQDSEPLKPHDSPQPESPNGNKEVEGEDGEAHYEPEMDDMRCMLYIHGGGYYFGSVVCHFIVSLCDADINLVLMRG